MPSLRCPRWTLLLVLFCGYFLHFSLARPLESEPSRPSLWACPVSGTNFLERSPHHPYHYPYEMQVEHAARTSRLFFLYLAVRRTDTITQRPIPRPVIANFTGAFHQPTRRGAGHLSSRSRLSRASHRAPSLGTAAAAPVKVVKVGRRIIIQPPGNWASQV